MSAVTISSSKVRGLPLPQFRAWLKALHDSAQAQLQDDLGEYLNELGSGPTLYVTQTTGLSPRCIHRILNEATRAVKFDLVDGALQAEGRTRMDDLYHEADIRRAAKATDGPHVTGCRQCGAELYKRGSKVCGFCAMEAGQPLEETVAAGEYEHYLIEMFS